MTTEKESRPHRMETYHKSDTSREDFLEIGRDLHLLFSLTGTCQSVATIENVRALLKRHLHKLIRATTTERGALFLMFFQGRSPLQVTAMFNDGECGEETITNIRDIAQKCVEGGETFVRAERVGNSSPRTTTSTDPAPQSLCCTPIQIKGRVWGAVYLDTFSFAITFDDYRLRHIAQFAEALAQSLEVASGEKRSRYTREELRKKFSDREIFDKIIGSHPKLLKVLELVARLADTDATVLISGESGTGKDLIARALHLNSGRRSEPFQPVNCGAIAENLLESELFGYEKGAFTGAYKNKQGYFAAAHSGTLFLDQIESTSPALQTKLLRFLETGEYLSVGSTTIKYCDVRIIAATNRDLAGMVERGTFRDDLYYRLNVFVLELPPLRERKEDLPLLFEYYLKNICEAERCPRKRLSDEAFVLLQQYDYPGNVRELTGILYRGVKLARGEVIYIEQLPEGIVSPHGYENEYSLVELKKRAADQVEKAYLIRALQRNHGVIRRAARMTGIDVKNFHSKIRKHGINPKKV